MYIFLGAYIIQNTSQNTIIYVTKGVDKGYKYAGNILHNLKYNIKINISYLQLNVF